MEKKLLWECVCVRVCVWARMCVYAFLLLHPHKLFFPTSFPLAVFLVSTWNPAHTAAKTWPRLRPRFLVLSNGWASSATAAGLPPMPPPPLPLELDMLWLQQQKWFSRNGTADSMKDGS